MHLITTIYHQGMVYGFGSRPFTRYSQNYKIRGLAINRGRGVTHGIFSYMLSCKFYHFNAPFENRGVLFCNCRMVDRSVGRYVCLSVCRPSVVRSIYFDPFTWSIPNLVQGLPLICRWPLLIFRSHTQRSRSNHSS